MSVLADPGEQVAVTMTGTGSSIAAVEARCRIYADALSAVDRGGSGCSFAIDMYRMVPVSQSAATANSPPARPGAVLL